MRIQAELELYVIKRLLVFPFLARLRVLQPPDAC